MLREEALIQAAQEGNINIVTQLLKQRINVNFNNKNYGTALHCACEYGHEDIATLLLSNGADINITDANLGMSPLHIASRNGQSDIIEVFLKYGANINCKDSDGDTPLHVAFMCIRTLYYLQDYGVIQVLLDNGANIDIMNHIHEKPEDVVSERFSSDLIALLQSKRLLHRGGAYTFLLNRWISENQKACNFLSCEEKTQGKP